LGYWIINNNKLYEFDLFNFFLAKHTNLGHLVANFLMENATVADPNFRRRLIIILCDMLENLHPDFKHGEFQNLDVLFPCVTNSVLISFET